MPKPQRAPAKKRVTLQKQQRERFDDLIVSPATSVFINCPYDANYAPLFDAIVFATTACGYLARSALESGSVAESRMERIIKPVFASRYSIHDLSRCRGEGSEALARFNMPLELGIAMARRFAGGAAQHDWLVLVPEGHEYLKFVSDLSAFDLKKHNGTVEGVVPKVMAWLATRPDAVIGPTPDQVLAVLPAFAAKKQELMNTWRDELPWADLILAAREYVPE